MKAFPTEHAISGTMSYCADGMDLRDYFAAKAMVVFVSDDVQKLYPEQWGMERVAEVAYEMANFMMKAREQ